MDGFVMKFKCIQMGTAHLYKLHCELAVEGGHLPLNAEFTSSYRERDDLIVSCTVANSFKDIQVFHHHVAVQTDIKHLKKIYLK